MWTGPPANKSAGRSFVVTVACCCLLLRGRGNTASALTVPLAAARPAASLQGLVLRRLGDDVPIDVGEALLSSSDDTRTLLVLATHPADFNAIEYGQRVRCALPDLRARGGVGRCLLVCNGDAASCDRWAGLLGLDDVDHGIEILPDPHGEAGRRFGVDRGWRPDDDTPSPSLKVTWVGLGLGPPWGTLPAVLTGYFGNPYGRRGWIEESLRQGQLKGRWPEVLTLEGNDDRSIVGNKFDDFPLVGGWGRRPFELATLRLQNIIGIQIKHWDALKPKDDRCLTQLGGCTVVGPGGEALYSWVDRGLCDVADMDELVEVLEKLEK